MKKLIAVLTAIIFVISVLSIPAAAADGKEPAAGGVSNSVFQGASPLLGKDALERVISLVKTRLVIPQEYKEFNSDVFDNNGKTMFRLRWSNNGSYYYTSGGSIEVTVDENGTVTSLYQYRYSRDYDYQRKLPSITGEQALDSARKFIGNMCPDIIGQVDFERGGDNYNVEFDGSYTFNFNRQYEGIPYYDNSLYIQVNGQTGAVMSFNRTWNDSLAFADAKDSIGLDKAWDAYKKLSLLKLRYRMVYTEGSSRSYLEYSPDASDLSVGIDALTGGKISWNSNNYPYYMGYRPYGYISDINLQGEELDELKQMEGLISAESAEKLARGMTELGLDGSYRLNRYSYGKYSGSGNYTLMLEFMRAAGEKDFGGKIPDEKMKLMIASGEGGGTASITFDAKTSDIISISAYGGPAMSAGGKSLTRDELQKAAEGFLKKYKADKFKQGKLVADTGMLSDYMMKYGYGGPGDPNSFVFSRIVNGIPFDANMLRIGFDPNTGKINSYSEAWDDADFTRAEGLISLEEAYRVLYEKNDFGLKYVTVVKQDTKQDIYPSPYGSPVNGDIKLIYSPNPGKPTFVDAKKGILLNQNGDPYKDKTRVQYNDTEGRQDKQQIEELALAGLLPATASFKPDDLILQKDYMLILARLKGGYNSGLSSDELSQTDQDGMYRMLINDGTMDEGEKAPDDAVTREDAVKFLLRTLGYRKFAEMGDIFECGFTDKAEISPGLSGYAAIARSMKLVDGTAFEPQRNLTRAEAVVIVYNYLKRKG